MTTPPGADSARVVVLISGRGTNLGALLDHQRGYRVVGVISNRSDAKGLQIAQRAGVNTTVVRHQDFDSRHAFDQQLANAVSLHRPDLVVLAGFMRVLGTAFVTRYQGRMVNIHPSLLPRFRGLNTHQRALEAGMQRHGASVHYVTADLDGGPVIAQAQIDIQPGDTPESLAHRLLPLEHLLLSRVVQGISEGLIRYEQGAIKINRTALEQPLLLSDDGGLTAAGDAVLSPGRRRD